MAVEFPAYQSVAVADLTLVLRARYRCWPGTALGVVIGGAIGLRPVDDPVGEVNDSNKRCPPAGVPFFLVADRSLLMSRKRSNRSRTPRGGLPVDNAVSMRETLKKLNPNAAGIDIGATMHFVAIPEGADDSRVRSFGTYTADLESIADWLTQCRVTTVAMESTGVYWIPLYELLERRGFEVILAEPSQMKKTPGRKSDVLDCQWIQQLHSFGLLRNSFRPDDAIVVLRTYLRQRTTLVHYAAAHVQHMQKALEQMNLKLTEVIDDITGKTGMLIIDAVLAGERDAKQLAKLRDRRCKNDEATIELALQGNWRDEHLFCLRQAVDLFRAYQQQLISLDAQIESYLATFKAQATEALPPRPVTRRKKGKHEPAFDVRTLLHQMTGVDLTSIDGIGPHAALQLVSETGTDMTRWDTDKHFCSWLTLCPGVNKTGGRKNSRSGRTRPSANRAATVFRLCAQSLLRTNTSLGAFGRRMRAKLGSPKAITALAHKLAKIYYGMLRYGKAYVDRGTEYYDQIYHQKTIHNLQRRARQLGYDITPNSQL